jgi:hypothetical protein
MRQRAFGIRAVIPNEEVLVSVKSDSLGSGTEPPYGRGDFVPSRILSDQDVSK